MSYGNDDTGRTGGYGNTDSSGIGNDNYGSRQGTTGLGDSDSYGSRQGTTGLGDSDSYGARQQTSGLRGSDTYGSSGVNQSMSGSDPYSSGGSGSRRDDDNVNSSLSGTDPYSSGGARRDDSGFRSGDNDRTSGGLGYDDTIGSSGRTGGVGRGGDQETSQYTSGGLGQNDTYGDETNTGGQGTARDGNFGMGTGRTSSQERGGIGHDVSVGGGSGTRRDDDSYGGDSYGGDDSYKSGSSKKNDSTMGKLKEKVGGMLKNEKLQESGTEQRREAGAYDNTSSDRY